MNKSEHVAGHAHNLAVVTSSSLEPCSCGDIISFRADVASVFATSYFIIILIVIVISS